MNTGHLRFLVLLAAISYLPTLAFYYVGEEAIFPITSLEMWHQREWLQQPLFGGSLLHNPLFNWLIIPFAALIGWEYMLPVARALTITSTLASSAVVGWLAYRLLRDAAFAWFAALVYLTLADVLLYRGWLAYVDPLFGLFVFSAIAALWVACEERRPALVAVAVICLTCAFLSKAFTAYVFYGVAMLALSAKRQHRQFLLGLSSIVAHVGAVLAPLVWLSQLPKHQEQGTRMFNEIIAKLVPNSIVDYFGQLLGFPLETVLRLSPAIVLVGYLLWRRRLAIDDAFKPYLKTAGLIAFINYLPYWLSPHGAIRYLVPLYPLIGFVLAIMLWRAWLHHAALVRGWLGAAIAFKLIAAAFIFPYYQSHYRGENYATTARDIIEFTAGHALYTTDVSASGLSVAGHIDAWRYPRSPPLRWVPAAWDSGFVLSYTQNPELGQVAQHYQLGGNDLYLLCRGAACGSGAR